MDEWMETWIATLKQLLGIADSDTSQDAALEFLAPIALQAIQSRTGRTFLHGIYEDTVNAPSETVYLTERPVIEVIEIGKGSGAVPDNFYSMDLPRGILRPTYCQCVPVVCCELPLKILYEANEAQPPNWVSLVAADAMRAAMAQQGSANSFGFSAKKVQVTDVGSVEFGAMGDSPAESLTMVIDASLSGWTEPAFSAGTGCHTGQYSTLVELL